ncbi:MAG TPA: hypothetical protein VFN76_09805 [Candidatus Limnocylindria bacterium]|nr:hypothetical protein [Candidatus Limnocylindria bacterium]
MTGEKWKGVAPGLRIDCPRGCGGSVAFEIDKITGQTIEACDTCDLRRPLVRRQPTAKESSSAAGDTQRGRNVASFAKRNGRRLGQGGAR